MTALLQHAHFINPLTYPARPFKHTNTTGRCSKVAERLEALRFEKELAETAECTFTPSISRRSDRLMAHRSAALRACNLSPHQTLYQDGLRRLAKQEIYESWLPEDATFRPALIAGPGGGRGRQSVADANGEGPAGGGAQPAGERLYATYERVSYKHAVAY